MTHLGSKLEICNPSTEQLWGGKRGGRAAERARGAARGQRQRLPGAVCLPRGGGQGAWFKPGLAHAREMAT